MAELPSRPRVLPHTEVKRRHLLTAAGPKGHGWPSGLIDFEPAILGEREYAFTVVGYSTPTAMAGS